LNVKNVVSVFLLLVIIGSCNSGAQDDPAPAAAPAPTTAPTTTPQATTTPRQPIWSGTVTSNPESVGEKVEVTEVVDGDTFKVADGRTIRVLGIDSCETGTQGGHEAKLAAEVALTGSRKNVTLVQEPGVDKDKYGRHLRYVKVDGEDFGLDMVQWDHTGIYNPKYNDASKQYLDQLYALDTKYSSNPPSGRECGGAWPPPASSSSGGGGVYLNNEDDDDDHHRHRRESRFCRKRWWC